MTRKRLAKHRAKLQTAITRRGFTMVEVLIVLLVLGMLAVLILNSLQLVKAKSRDANRRTEINTLAQQLENCYNDKCHGAYPSLTQLTDTAHSGFVATNFNKDFNTDALFDSSNGLVQAGSASAATQYQYIVSPDSCTGTTGSTPCSGFTLRTYQETNPENPYTKESLKK